MLLSKVRIALFKTKVPSNDFLLIQYMKYNNRVNVMFKRGAVLVDMITNKDKRKKWHFNILSEKPKVRVFDKIHKPRRRENILNSLFIRNITDVISTGEIAPELSSYGVEITGVKISPCNKLLNVFWQIPASRYVSSEDIGKLLIAAAPRIRAELISRNVLGRVPYIFFIRDGTNERISQFEMSMQKLDLGPECDSAIVVDDSFTKDIYSFKAKKVQKKINYEAVSDDDDKELISDSNTADTKEVSDDLSQKSAVMKCDIFGLDQEQIMDKVIISKKKKKNLKTAVISPDNLNNDLFENIPGVCFEAASSRDEILKKFQIERKMLKENKINSHVNDSKDYEDYIEDTDDTEFNSYEEDFIDDETTENSYYK